MDDTKGTLPSNPGIPDLKFVNPSSAPAGTPSPAPRPLTPPAPAVPQEYRTSIRTMSDDIAKIKVGQAPTGTDIKKTIVPGATPAPAPAPLAPKPPVPLGAPGIRVGLGDAQKTKPLSSFGSPSAPAPAPSAPSQFTLPEAAPHRPSNRLYILIVIAALLVGALYWFLVANKQETVVQNTPTPIASRTATPVPTPKTLSGLLVGTTETVVVASSGNPTTDFLAKVHALAPAGGQVKKISVVTASKGVSELSPIGLLDRFLVSYPPELKTALGGEGVILVYGQKETYDTKGVLIPAGPVQTRLGLVSEIKDVPATIQAMKTWEATLANALSSLFEFIKTKAATPGFLDNTYRQTAIRYKNFPYADRTIDYSVVTASNGKNYLVMTDSREATFFLIDKLK